MTLFIFGFGLMLLPILFCLALKLRLGVPMLYAALMLTAFHGWYQPTQLWRTASFSP